MFSLCVPRKRWSGRTQAGVSHLCKTHIPEGISPLYRKYATLCAPCNLPPSLKRPYPSPFFVACHNQQSFVTSTFSMNRSLTLCLLISTHLTLSPRIG